MTIFKSIANVNRILILCALPFLGTLSSCTNNAEEKCVFIPETKKISFNLSTESLEDSVPAITSKKQLVNFLKRHALIRDNFLGRQNYPNDSAFLNGLYKQFTHPSFDTLLMESHRVFGDGADLREEFKKAFADLKYYYPGFRIPKIVTIITGFQSGADLLVTDSVIVVGLDYYLGKGAKYRPNDMYGYILRRYQPNFIVPSVLLLYGISPEYNKTNLEDKTLLADMVSYGKAYYFARHMLPCVPDSVFIGYTSEEIKGCKKYEDLIFVRFIENEVLFSTSHQIKQKYLEERPKTLEVGEKCPGRIAQWVGWQIVKNYGKRDADKTLVQIMNTRDPAMVFKESKYKPDHK